MRERAKLLRQRRGERRRRVNDTVEILNPEKLRIDPNWGAPCPGESGAAAVDAAVCAGREKSCCRVH